MLDSELRDYTVYGKMNSVVKYLRASAEYFQGQREEN